MKPPRFANEGYNYIYTSIKLANDGKQAVATVTMNVAGEQPLYIEYNETQLVNLVEIMQRTLFDVQQINANMKG